ncbi:hypothetical protein GCM10023201_56480 [Actinomycetospora corticicola]
MSASSGIAWCAAANNTSPAAAPPAAHHQELDVEDRPVPDRGRSMTNVRPLRTVIGGAAPPSSVMDQEGAHASGRGREGYFLSGVSESPVGPDDARWVRPSS